jgi:hypothetical protein
MALWWSKGGRRLSKVTRDEVSAIAGNDWATVWRKLEIIPYQSGSSLIGELRIGGKPAQPIIVRLGVGDTAEVLEILGRALGLSQEFSLEFLRCKRSRKLVLEVVEERLLSYNVDANESTQ